MSTSSERRNRAAEAHREAMALLESERAERNEKTAKLRALRLAKEASEASDDGPKPVSKKKLTFDALLAGKARTRQLQKLK
jgi:hypothetical protein